MIDKSTQKMADLLFGDFYIRQPRRHRQFRGHVDIANLSDNELRARYRFGRQAIQYITDLLADDLRRNTRRNHALPPLQQVLIALRFFCQWKLSASDWRHCWCGQVHHFLCSDECVKCFLKEAEPFY